MSRPSFPGLPPAINLQQSLLLAQLQILRKLDRARNERGHALAMLAMSILMLTIWVHVAVVLAKTFGTMLPFGH